MRMTKAELEAAWQSGQIHSVGHSVTGEPNVQDLLDSFINYDDADVLTYNTHYGRGTLVGGECYVATADVEADTCIWLTGNVPGGTPGFLYVQQIWAGGSFLAKSSSATDTSTFAWLMLDPDF
jgi:hypothetical protein